MKTMMRSMAMLGCVALLGSATMAHAGEMPAGAEDDGHILTIGFIGERSSSVTLHYKVYEKGASTLSAMILMESLKRKLAETGFERLQADDGYQGAVHNYSVFIIGDTGFSEEAHALEKRDGDLMVVILENEKLTAVNTAHTKRNGLEYRQIENMADEIVTRLLFHSFI